MHCLSRNFNSTSVGTNLPSPFDIDDLIQGSLSYDRFRQRLEFGPHAIVHSAIGGTGGDMNTMASPNDPIFWLVHSYIDRLWFLWQKKQQRLVESGLSGIGPNDFGGRDQNGNQAQESTILNPFNIPVSQIFDEKLLCYTYSS